ncbi:MAG: G5 domain-containing protein [Oscillospiraceae bacterium]|nr:G5 domain-containing protein [Oscillospiraceae bacterium]
MEPHLSRFFRKNVYTTILGFLGFAGKLKKTAAVIAAAAGIIMLGLLTTGLSMHPNTVYIYDMVGNTPQAETPAMVYTDSLDLNVILAETKLGVSDEDEVEFSGFKNGAATLTVRRAFDVKVTADGRTRTLRMSSGNVGDALKQADVKVSGKDLINLSLSDPVDFETEIKINRVRHRKVTKTQKVPFKTQTKKAGWIKKGKEKVAVSGKPGKQKRVYQQTFIDGKLSDTKLVKRSVVQKPVQRVKLKGTGTVDAVSPFPTPSDFKLNKKGAPVDYKKKITGRAMAYTARSGARTATGRPAKIGNVAVNPKVIPYGTKMYITSKDGAYVYGIAVAADTGTTLKRNKIVVDLFFDTVRDCYRFGVRNVNIYILK